jgi:antitoxin component YwqK of YwqJK toxin-antitoxin module
MKLLLLLSFVLSLGFTHASDNNGQGEDEPGKTDESGRKQGHWIVKGKHKPQKNYPPEDKIEEGDYKDSRRNGEWTFFHIGNVPKLKTTFVNNKASGKYIKYHTNGNLKEEGEYRMGRQVGGQTQYFEDGKVKRKQTYNSVGKPVGKVVEYHSNGEVALEANIDPKTMKRTSAVWKNEDGSVKREVKYGPDGRPTDVKEGVVKQKAVVGEGQAASKPVGTVTKDGKPFNPDGFNMLYKNDELYQVGKFKAGRLWEGKFYKYDADGLLLKIEKYKGGKYHSDGQM